MTRRVLLRVLAILAAALPFRPLRLRATGVTDSFGRTYDHDNLFVVGSPTLPTAGCTNGTLTFVALTLRSAGEIVR